MGYSSSTELFVEWAVGLVIIAVRIYARWTLGKQSFYWDDLCLGFVTVSLPSIHISTMVRIDRSDILDLPHGFSVPLHRYAFHFPPRLS
jgi:hypothetical protein